MPEDPEKPEVREGGDVCPRAGMGGRGGDVWKRAGKAGEAGMVANGEVYKLKFNLDLGLNLGGRPSRAYITRPMPQHV